MFPKKIIYQFGSTRQGEIFLRPSLPARVLYVFLRGLGAGLIAFGVICLIFTFGPILIEEVSYKAGKKTEVVAPSGFGKILVAAQEDRVRQEAKSYGLNSSFSLVIPKIDAWANITANVDAGDEEEYQKALTKGVAHARGTGFPGEGLGIFLFAHSTDTAINISRYNAVFYLLRKLEPGDPIIVFFADKKYNYTVERKEVVAATDTSWLTEAKEGETLILQTCYPPGTTLKRLLVVAKPVEGK